MSKPLNLLYQFDSKIILLHEASLLDFVNCKVFCFLIILKFKNVTEIDPNYADGHINLGVAIHDQGMFKKAVEAYHKALYIKPNSSDLHYNLGDSLQKQGKLEDAIIAYKQALTLNPGFYEVHSNLGNIFQI